MSRGRVVYFLEHISNTTVIIFNASLHNYPEFSFKPAVMQHLNIHLLYTDDYSADWVQGTAIIG